MDEPFIISLFYKNKEHHFPAQLFTTAYSYRIQVLIDDIAFNFERDDEGNFRALAAQPDEVKIQNMDTRLLQAIADKLEDLLS